MFNSPIISLDHMLLLSSKLMLLFKLLQFIRIEFSQNYGWTFLDDAAGV